MSIRFQKLIFFRVAILALLAGFSFSAHATTYYWQYGSTGPTGSSPSTVCQTQIANQGGGVWTYDKVLLQTGSNAGQYMCYYKYNGGSFGLGLIQLRGDSCPSGQTLFTTTSDAYCAVPPTCTSPKVVDPSTGECAWPTTCPQGQVLFKITNSGGGTASARCVPQVQTPPTQPCITWSQNQSYSCQKLQSDCTASGGSFGVIGTSNVCIPGGNPDTPPPCAAGASQFVTNADGSSSPSCVGTANISGSNNVAGQPVSNGSNTASTSQAQSAADTANNTAAIAKINNEGFQGVVNAINNMSHAGGGGSGNGSSAAQDQSNTAGIIQAINDFKNQEKGAGQCDPKKSDYAKCIGQSQDAPDADGSAIRGNAKTQGDGFLENAKSSLTDAIANRADAQSPDGIVGTVLSYLPQVDSCSDYSTSIKGVAFSVRCDQTQMVRDWGAWVFAVATILFCFHIVFVKES